MKIFLASDHQGYKLKSKIFAYLSKRGVATVDLGAETLDPNDDFPQFASAAALAVIGSDDPDPRAILLCGGGQGMAMAANRYRGIRAVVLSTVDDAKLARHDNDANVLALPAGILDQDDDEYWQNVVDAWLDTPFDGAERFVRRNKQLDELS